MSSLTLGVAIVAMLVPLMTAAVLVTARILSISTLFDATKVQMVTFFVIMAIYATWFANLFGHLVRTANL
jgi:hypothetical protein